MAKAAATKEKDPLNFVHQNAILCETITKEQRHQKLYTNYSVNPFKKIHVITGKPNSRHDTEEGEEDSHFKNVIKRANQEPVKKYVYPQTESQEIGWITKPLIDSDRSDRRLNFYRQNTPITKYMDAAWRVKEQTENMN
ncbi:protein FAM183B-like [Crassostrea angulata]|uniref:Protein FAM183A n=1 Tax=Magallana gigas TaxID=29159 RepID=K1PUK5_MAGGI|nr:protein FAM183B [Crassostrea gigas]XP_052689958.1 protein FAM183B-like [Crassostrea angulata]|eukprot:XP_011428758.1 PREDICTED: protein FAM183B [Crassostrea gigas]